MELIKLFNAFWVGGVLCVIAQLLIDCTKLTPARIMVSYVIAGILLTGIGLYEPLVRFAGSGATTPIIGFGYTLAKGTAKAVSEKGIVGAMTGGVAAAAGGISASVFFGLVFSLISRSKPKNPKR